MPTNEEIRKKYIKYFWDREVNNKLYMTDKNVKAWNRAMNEIRADQKRKTTNKVFNTLKRLEGKGFHEVDEPCCDYVMCYDPPRPEKDKSYCDWHYFLAVELPKLKLKLTKW